MPASRGGNAQTKLAEWRLRRGLSQAEHAWRDWYPFDLSTAPEPPDHARLWREPLDD